MNSKRRMKNGNVILAVILCVIALLCQLLAGPLYVRAKEEIGEYELYAKAAVLMDGDSKRVLHGKNEDLVLPMASTTKIMTCIVALEQGALDDVLTVSSYAASQPKVHLGMRKGEQYVLRDLLYSLMLESHNDSAVAIAEHVGGKTLGLPEASERTTEESKQAVAAFAKLMNEKAQELGCENTYYITPNGLDAGETVEEQGQTVLKQHSTTAAELARVMCYCAWESEASEKFLEITRQRNYSFLNVSGSRSFSCTNHNAFLDQMDGALTGKTGFTNAAGYCYVGALEKDGEKYAVALLACGWPNNKNWKWSDTKLLMNYGLENYELHEGTEWEYDENKLPQLHVENGQTEKIGGSAYVALELTKSQEAEKSLLLRTDEEIKVLCDVQKVLSAPVEKGQQVGTVKYFLGEKMLWEEKIVVSKSIPGIDFKWCFKQILSLFFIM